MNPRPVPRNAFSLLELIVIITIVAILLAISIPVVRDMRSLSRRSNCDQNLSRLVMACQAYADNFKHLPSGTLTTSAQVFQNGNLADTSPAETLSILSLPEGYHHNWISSLLRYLDREALYDSIDFEVGVSAPANDAVRETSLAFLRCPASIGEQIPNTTSYAGMHASQAEPIGVNNDGLLMLNRWIALSDIADGTAYTILLGEKLSPPEHDLGWMSGTRSSLRNAGTAINESVSSDVFEDPHYVGGLGSLHAGGASVGMADGAVKFLQDSIDPAVFQAMVNREDN
ncbi:DUF1559 family PulG-like putative transporter [Allorhodopirellula solitaria]|nr:DUF1559 domain-containing protein [Allorhodopirellula solitaria]